MPSSPIRKLAPYADAAKRNGVHVYHLNIGQPDIKTPQCGLDALKAVDRSILEYSPSDGYLSLRTKMVQYYAEYGIYLSPEEIIVTTGGSEAVLFAFLACLGPGDEVIVTDPFYANYMAFAISVGAVIKSVKTHPAHQGHPHLQPQQPDGLPLYPQGDAAPARYRQEAQSLPVQRRGVP